MTRIDKLMGEMTLAEKLGQLTMTSASYAVTGPIIAGDSTESIRNGTIGNLLNMIGKGPVHQIQRIAVEESRLGIPLLIGLDVIHGHRTIFPIPLGEAAAFDPKLWALTAREAAREATADGIALTFAPMLDISRDPRWGRTAEGPGEDTLVAVEMARAKVHGFQGMDLASDESLAACAKHFVAYGPVTAGRDYASVDISERTLHEVYLPAFAAAVKAGVLAVMPAFTDLAGIPMTAHIPLLRDYLRGKLGFDGVLISDYNAIGELLRHCVAGNIVEAAAMALKAGVDIDMMSDAYRRALPAALDRGLVEMDDIDVCVRRVLLLKERLGLFDDPYRRGTRSESPAHVTERRRIAREAGARSLVLLKNENETLPLRSSLRKLCVIGPLADASREMRGPWAAAGYEPDIPHVSVLSGLRAALPSTEIAFASGGTIAGEETEEIPAAVKLCAGANAIVLCLGEAAEMSGEAASRATPELPGQQLALAKAVIERARQDRIPVISVVFSGRPLVITWLAEHSDAVIAAWFPGSEAGNAIADVLTGRVAPVGRTPVTWPRVLGQVPIFHSQRPSGRPMNPGDHYTSKYLDAPNEPLYPFGHGLTYSTFSLSDLKVASRSVTEKDTVTVTVEVKNEGKRPGEETVFLFTRDKVASVVRPVLELRAFTRIFLQPGESGTATLHFPASELAFPGADLKPVFEPGEIEILVGRCADRTQMLDASIEVRA
jgi:beta-glucosidase